MGKTVFSTALKACVPLLVIMGTALYANPAKASCSAHTETLPSVGYSSAGKLMACDGTNWIEVSSGGGSTLWLTSGSNLYYTAGNVGIGTASPNAELAVESSVNPSLSLHASTAGKQTQWLDYDNDTLVWFRGINYNNAGDGHYFVVRNSGTGHFLIDPTGAGVNVGIGTNNPSYTLDVNGDLFASGKIVQHGADFNIYDSTRCKSDATDSLGYCDTLGRALVHNTGDRLSLNFNDDFDGGVQVGSSGPWFATNGNVGIGKTPSYPLDVTSGGLTARFASTRIDTAAGSAVAFDRSSTEGNIARFEYGGTTVFGVDYYSASGALLTSSTYPLNINGSTMTLKTGATARMTIDASGNVGIGTSTPTALFQVDGGDASMSYTGNSSESTLNLKDDVSSKIWQLKHSITNDAFHLGYYTGSAWLFPFKVEADAPTDSLIVDSDGRVGVNMTPVAQLDVSSNSLAGRFISSRADGGDVIYVNRSSGDGAIMRLESAAKAVLGFEYYDATGTLITARLSDALRYSAPEHQFLTSGVQRMTLDASGNVGIGISTPEQTLHVSGDTGMQIDTANGWYFRLKDTGAASGLQNWAIVNNSHSGLLAFKPRDDAWVGLGDDKSIFFTRDGKVGIGINSPAYALDVAGTISATQYWWNDTVNWIMHADDSVGDYSFNFEDSDGDDVWLVWSATYGAILAVRNNDRVGVGTSNPASTLDVIGDLKVSDGGQISNVIIGQDSAEIDMAWAYESIGATSGNFRLQSIGGIGFHTGMTSSEGNNNDKRRMWLGDTGILTVYGPSTTCNIGNGTGTTACSSDVRLKTDITPLQNALDKVAALQGVNFKWKSDENATNRVGLIAQDVEKIYPEVVETNEETGMKSVAYASLVGPLIEAIKELKAENDALRARVEALEAR